MIFLTLAPRARTARTACITDPPLVVTSSNRMTFISGLKLPSIFRSVPWSLISLRTTKP
jgi:hypothetical protein